MGNDKVDQNQIEIDDDAFPEDVQPVEYGEGEIPTPKGGDE